MITGRRPVPRDSDLLKPKVGIFEPKAAHFKVAEKWGFDMSKPQRGAVDFKKQNIRGKSSQDTYEPKLAMFWKFLKKLGREGEQFMLFNRLCRRSPGISVESLMLFLMYKNDVRRQRGENYLCFNGKPVLDRNGKKIRIKERWGRKGSLSSFRIFINAINNVHAISMHDFAYR